ncbi:MAG: MFS transporter [Bacteroidales bacterium]|nr:MFS transporter [Bacteroidales bacterium]MBN2761888.1 MFS transporter [Bacteroidales bacterium]
MRPIIKGDKKITRGWVVYDFANSVYQLTIGSTIFPIYYNAITRQGDIDTISFFGFKAINSVLYSWAIAISYLIVAMFSPLFSSIADYTGRRKLFMMIFTWIGAFSCGILFFFNRNTIELGLVAFTFATIGYGGSLVFYNSFLPIIAEPADQDRISARGYALGYVGGVSLLIINLIFVLFPEFFGITDSTLPPRLAFATVFLWWIGFSQITFRRLPKYTFGKREKGANVILKGYQELRSVFNQVMKMSQLKIYLVAFFFMTMGLLTIMFMAATYGTKELGLADKVLIPTILLIQLVGIGGAWSFARFSGRFGNVKTLIFSIMGWIAICIGAYLIKGASGFIVVAMCVGFVMGGTQALARSTYSKMLPETRNHTSFFSFYDVMEKIASVGGTFSFGIIEAITGSMRYSVLAIITFFLISLVFMIVLLYIQEKEKRLQPAL